MIICLCRFLLGVQNVVKSLLCGVSLGYIPPPPFLFFPLVQRRGVAPFHKSGKRVVTTRMIMETVWLYRAVGKCVIVWLPPEAEALQKCRAEIGQPTLIASKSKSAFFFFFFFFFVPLWFLSSCVRIRGCCRRRHCQARWSPLCKHRTAQSLARVCKSQDIPGVGWMGSVSVTAF